MVETDCLKEAAYWLKRNSSPAGDRINSQSTTARLINKANDNAMQNGSNEYIGMNFGSRERVTRATPKKKQRVAAPPDDNARWGAAAARAHQRVEAAEARAEEAEDKCEEKDEIIAQLKTQLRAARNLII